MNASFDQLLTCEDEQLHLSGAIQDHGGLLVLSADLARITHVSCNIERFLGGTVNDYLDARVTDLPWLADEMGRLPDRPGQSFTTRLTTADESGRMLGARVTRADSGALVELEFIDLLFDSGQPDNIEGLLISLPADPQALAAREQMLVEAFAAIIRYERVMLYRFHDDWSGEVCAEISHPEMGSYLGLRFPASDIPAIARQIYLKTRYRHIPDVSDQLSAIASADGETPDLTWSDLRSVSPFHLQYLRNMGVSASFSVPIRVNGRLWGLVACHHPVPRMIGSQARELCVALANAHSIGLSSFLAAQRTRLLDNMGFQIDRLLADTHDVDTLRERFASRTGELLALLDADSVLLCVDNQFDSYGKAPATESCALISHWVRHLDAEPVLITDYLQDAMDRRETILGAAGLLAIQIPLRRAGSLFLVWLRTEETGERLWAGNPNKPTAEDPAAPNLSPRHSFELWRETRTGYSRPWRNESRLIATRVRSKLIREMSA